ncbi:MAG: TlyA family RNA methyltransferase [Ruminococcaceae bacterium]|nr:TlyA family RNA methyltransferase [Oscillospiraceae bacterium]
MAKKRLDILIHELGMADTLSKAKAIIMSGIAFVDGQKLDKPGTMIDVNSKIEVRDNAKKYVSRGGYKLEKALEVFGIDPSEKICIDCGASTGGFTDVLLKRGAKRVYAVDVGYGLLDWSIRKSEKVTIMERTNVRYLKPEDFEYRPSIAVFDLSFISLQLVLKPVSEIVSDDANFICLLKPQFESEKADVGSNGIIKDPLIHEKVLYEFIHFAKSSGFTVRGITHSPITGTQGNIEFLVNVVKGSGTSSLIDIKAVVACAHEELS